MPDSLHAWIASRFLAAPTAVDDPPEIRVASFGALPWTGETAVWHPLGDLRTAPRVPLRGTVTIESVHIGRELVGYVLRGPGEIATWRELGDASTDADRFFLVEASTIEPVIDWFNEELETFEELGGSLDVETVARGDVRLVVIESPDGNARVRGGFSPTGELVAAVIEAGPGGKLTEGLELFARVAPAGELACAVVAGETRQGAEPFAGGRNDRVCAFVASRSASGGGHDHAGLVESTFAGLLGNTGDRADSVDLAVRAREPPGVARFTRARVPALLRGANAQLREHQVRSGMRDMPAISAAILTAHFGRATIASVGDGVAVHRLRRGRVERLTPPLPRIAPGIPVPRPQDLLGWTDDPDVFERDDVLERGDIFVLCGWSGSFVPDDLLAAMAHAGSFERALGVCFDRLGPGTLLLAHWR